MIIHAYILAWNEEAILPYTLDYYTSICEKVFIYDNMSNDNSDKIYAKYKNVVVIKWSSDNQIHEGNYVQIKSMAYKNSRGKADWVIVCDCDEFLYHENLKEKLIEYKAKGITVPLISGHDMVSEEFPVYDGSPIFNLVKVGSEIYEPMCKRIIFDPAIDAQFGIGAHSFSSNNTIPSESAELKLLHYKFLGKDYIQKMYKMRAERLSKFNLDHQFGVHYFNPPFEYMDRLLKENNQVI